MRDRVLGGLLVLVAVIAGAPAMGQEALVRVATYNIMFLDADQLPSQGQRKQRLLEVVRLLDADVIGLQEIEDRRVLREIFPASDWILLIDDDSDSTQDVALAVRKPLGLQGVADGINDVDADDEHFLFSAESSTFFPDRRDVLFGEIVMPDINETFFVMVVHAKARGGRGGRPASDPRREGAARLLIQKLEHDFHETNFVLLGDFNDNPDDASLNILEKGDPNAGGGPENDSGPFLINLTEPLLLLDRVSHGRTNGDIRDGRIDTTDFGSRVRNNDLRGINQHSGDILFDQLLIPQRLLDNYVQDSAWVFDFSVAVEGDSSSRASDHLPVSIELAFGPMEPEELQGVQIVSLLPDPVGRDQGNEEVTMRNLGATSQSLAGWKLRDRAGNEFSLAGTIPAGQSLVVEMTTFDMPLNNSGDEISLVNDENVVIHIVNYDQEHVQRGVPIGF